MWWRKQNNKTSFTFKLTSEDFNHYDFIFGMDEENMKDLNRKAPKGSKAKLLLFGDFDPEGDRIIRDPYYVCTYSYLGSYLLCWHYCILTIKSNKISNFRTAILKDLKNATSNQWDVLKGFWNILKTKVDYILLQSLGTCPLSEW